MSLAVDTENYRMSQNEEQRVRELSMLPRLNLRQGQIIEMRRSGRRSIIDIAKLVPNRITLMGGNATIEHLSNGRNDHPLDLTPSRVVAAYYLRSTIPFRLGGDVISN